MNEALLQIREPEDYFSGIGNDALPVPRNILLYVRREKKMLQQEALQNRSHHRFVLIYNLETEGNVHVNHLELVLRPGQTLLIHPYQFHHFSHLASNDLRWLFCTFELGASTFFESLRNHVADTSLHTQASFNDLVETWLRPASIEQNQQLQASLLHLLLRVQEDDRKTMHLVLPDPGTNDHLLRRVNQLLGEWRGRTVVIADLAEALQMSESRLRALFRETAGIPLGRYVLNYRINQAMALLRNSKRSISDIAEESGFGSPQAFSRIFKKSTGQSPRDYRTPQPF